jgi:8-oxo-dGTP pyrophosphatase MutT (NUDIX family)
MPDTLVFPGGRLETEDGAPDDASSFERAARRECLEEAAIDLGDRPLHWFDTWLTPSAEPRRYLARFFIASIDAAASELARADGHETTEGRWAPADHFLARWEAGGVDLPPPTLSILLRLARDDWFALLQRRPEQVCAPIVPKLAAHGAGLHILMPHHPDYADAPGESGSRPARIEELPLGFWRDGNRWRPVLA